MVFYVVFYPYKPEKANLGRTWSLKGTCRACLEAGTCRREARPMSASLLTWSLCALLESSTTSFALFRSRPALSVSAVLMHPTVVDEFVLGFVFVAHQTVDT